MKYTFNDEMGNRGRACRYRVFYKGNIYTKEQSISENIAVWRAMNYEKNGKWSNTTWEVTTVTGRLLVCMSPFNGWPESIAECLKHVQSSSVDYLGEANKPTTEEAETFFRVAYSAKWSELTELDTAEGRLL